ncbi:hypothetical protein ACFMQL_23245 [Nonomuraea fastidiosa]|jgi:acyl-CoA synthetase (AMP-forming)/AMP-acid ligase II|uniref:hypothetical protein n=1 Tax=Nonomuraea TaxID=83681 RepID=UPI0032438BD1
MIPWYVAPTRDQAIATAADVGVLDEAGDLAIVDRKKELYIVNGFNVSPAEVESPLPREGSPAQAAVIGVPDPVQGLALRRDQQCGE